MAVPQKTPVPNPASSLLDSLIQRLQNIEPFNVHTIDQDGNVLPWYDVTGPEIVGDVVVRHYDLETQVRAVSGHIMQWGRLTAQAQRVVEIEERRFTQWKAKQYLAGIEKAEGKKPSDKVLEAEYRTHPEYEVMRQRVERAAEAANSCDAILLAFKAKKDALIKFARVARDQGSNFSV